MATRNAVFRASLNWLTGGGGERSIGFSVKRIKIPSYPKMTGANKCRITCDRSAPREGIHDSRVLASIAVWSRIDSVKHPNITKEKCLNAASPGEAICFGGGAPVMWFKEDGEDSTWVAQRLKQRFYLPGIIIFILALLILLTIGSLAALMWVA